MHVHANHLNLAPPIESGGATRTAAAQRAADVRKRLMNSSADGNAFEEAASENMRIGEPEETGARRTKKQSKPRADFRAANVSEDESAIEQRTSVWA